MNVNLEETLGRTGTTMPRRSLRNIGLLAICQALTQSSNTLMFASSALAVLTIEDTGPGFDEETRRRLFEPFFSTKTQGSGLGLALVRKVAEDHMGSASLDRDGALTRAILSLPLSD